MSMEKENERIQNIVWEGRLLDQEAQSNPRFRVWAVTEHLMHSHSIVVECENYWMMEETTNWEEVKRWLEPGVPNPLYDRACQAAAIFGLEKIKSRDSPKS